MASFESVADRYRENVAKPKAKADGKPSANDGPGVANALLRGLYRSPGRAVETSEMLLGRSYGPVVDLNGDGKFTVSEHAAQKNRYSENALRQLSDASGIAAPITHSEKIAERVGEQGLNILAGGAGGIATGGLKGLAAEIAAGVVGTAGSETAAEAGAGPSGQLAAGIAATAVMPTVAIPSLAKSARRAAVHSAKRAAKELPSDAAQQVAKRYGVEPEYVQKVSSELKRRIGDKRALDRARRSLGDDDLFQELAEESMPTSRQFLGKRAGQNIASMEEGLARADVDFSTSISNRKVNAFEDVADMFDDFRPSGGIDDTISTTDDVVKDILENERNLWASVDLDSMGTVDTRAMKVGAAVSKKRAAGFSGRIPDEVAVIEALPDRISMSHFQRIRSNALLSKRVASRATDSGATFKGNNLDPILDALNRQLDTLPDDGSEAYRQALALTRKNRELLDPKSGYLKAIESGKRGKQVVNQIKASRSEAKRALALAQKADDGVPRLRRAMLDDLFGEEFGSRNPRAMRKQLSDFREAYSEIFDDATRSRIDRFIDELEVIQTGLAGTAAAARVAGSNIGPLQFLFGAADAVLHPLESGRMAVKAVRNRISKDITDNIERSALIREALLDRKLFLTLIDMPDERALPAWIVQWDQLVAKAKKTRPAQGKTIARQASGVSTDE